MTVIHDSYDECRCCIRGGYITPVWFDLISSPSFSSYHLNLSISYLEICISFKLFYLSIIFKRSSHLLSSFAISSKLLITHLHTIISLSHHLISRPFSQRIQLKMKSFIFINLLLAGFMSTVSAIYRGKVSLAYVTNLEPLRWGYITIPYRVLTPVDDCKTSFPS